MERDERIPIRKLNSFRNRATRGFAWNYLYKLTEFGLLNLYTILVVRHFGPNLSAPYAVFAALCTIISAISAFAVDGVLLRYVQRIASNADLLTNDFTKIESLNLRFFFKKLFAFRLFNVTIISIIIFICFYILPYIFPSLYSAFGSLRELSPFIFIYLYAQSIIAFCTFSLIGLLETKRVFFASLTSRSFLLIAGVLFVLQGSLSLISAVEIFVLSAIINAIYLLFIFTSEINKENGRSDSKRFPFNSIIYEIKELLIKPRHIKIFLATPLMLYGITTWGSDILSAVLGRQPDILMMRGMLGEKSSEIGYYLSASLMLLITEYIFLFGLGGTLVSIFSKIAHDDERDSTGNNYPLLAHARKEIAGFQNVVLLPLCAYMMIFAPNVIRAIYGVKYDAAIPLFRVGLVALSLTVGIFGGGMQITTLVAIGKERLVFRNRLYWGIANVVANIFLIWNFGGLGAIIGTQFANASACATEYYLAQKFTAGSFNYFSTIQILIISVVSVTISYVIVTFVIPEGSDLPKAIIGGIITLIFIVSGYALFKLPEARRVWMRLRDLFKQSQSTAFIND